MHASIHRQGSMKYSSALGTIRKKIEAMNVLSNFIYGIKSQLVD